MDTLDILVQHNYNKADPLVGDYNADVQAFAQGKCATFFMGDWAWTSMTALENIDTEYGFLPVPWSNDPAAYGSTQVVMVLPKFNAIDKSQSTPEQQKAAIDVLEWMLTQPDGQQFFLDAGFSMPYKNVRSDVVYNTMTQSIADYASQGKTINLGCFSYITGDAWTQTGNLMLQYISGAIDRQQFGDHDCQRHADHFLGFHGGILPRTQQMEIDKDHLCDIGCIHDRSLSGGDDTAG